MPKRKSREEPADGAAPENGGDPPPAAPTTPEGVPGISPPGMRLRSGRKKRRRADGEEASTDDDDSQKRPTIRRSTSRRRSKRKSKTTSDDESSMSTDAQTEDDESVDSSNHKKPEPINGHKAPLPTVVETEEMQDEEMEEEEAAVVTQEKSAAKAPVAAQAPPAVAAERQAAPAAAAATQAAPVARAAAAAAAPPNGDKQPAGARLEPIAKLRMPSKHTPGKLETTAPAPGRAGESRRLQFGEPTTDVLHELPPAAAGVASPSSQPAPQPAASPEGLPSAQLASVLAGEQTAESQHVAVGWYQSASESVVAVFYSLQEVATSMVVPPPLYAEGEEVEVEPLPPLLTRPYVWFLLLLLIQLVCWPSALNTLEGTSARSRSFYKSLFGTTKQPAVVMEKPPPAVEMDTTSKQHLEELQSLRQLLRSLDKDMNINDEMEAAEKKLKLIRGRVAERRVSLDDWYTGLVDVESAVGDLAKATSMDAVPSLYFRANEILGFFTDMVPPDLATELLDTHYLFLWEPAPGTCTERDDGKPDDDDDNVVLTPAQLESGQDELRQLALTSSREIMENDELAQSLRAWIRDFLLQNATSTWDKEMPPLAVGLSKDSARSVIADRLEIHQADQTGRIDYASISTGATVVYWGDRRTSPSLVDSLPLLNRLLQQARLRFYGYGPKAALTPTVPSNALGQCWAFGKDMRLDKDSSYGGRYATLTVRLAEPIHVTSVSVEHAPKELTDQLQSAIQEFRILGFTDANAEDSPWHLGSFRYDIDAPRTLQEFNVATSIDDEPFPKFHSVTLAIDSNWDFPYSCLYRFRIHGDDDDDSNRRVREEENDADVDDFDEYSVYEDADDYYEYVDDDEHEDDDYDYYEHVDDDEYDYEDDDDEDEDAYDEEMNA